MSDTVEDLMTRRLPTAARPLLGLTLLLVEDSRYTSEAMRLLCLRSGARLRRADSLRAARRHLEAYRPSVLIVDLGLPDGSGTELISEMAHSDAELPIIAISGDDMNKPDAMAAGACAFLSKPVPNLGSFQSAILACLPQDSQPRGPRELSNETVHPDAVALQDDLAHAAELLRDPIDANTLSYVTKFLAGVALTAGDVQLADQAERLRRTPSLAPQLLGELSERMQAVRPI